MGNTRLVARKELKRMKKKDRDRLDSFADSLAAMRAMTPEEHGQTFKLKAVPEGTAAEAMAKLSKALSGFNSKKEINTVTVRWHDGYKEVFRATEVRFGCDLLWMRLEDGSNRHIPLRSVRWFGTSIESHQSTGF